MKNLKIICDSLSDVPKDLLDKYDIDIVSLTVILEEKNTRIELIYLEMNFIKGLEKKMYIQKLLKLLMPNLRKF